MLTELGRNQEAVAPAEEAVSIYRRLAEVSPDVYLNDLATSTNTLTTDLADLHQKALASDESFLATPGSSWSP